MRRPHRRIPRRRLLVSATTTTLTVEWTHPGDGGSPLTRNFVALPGGWRYRLDATGTAGETPTPVTRAVITNLQADTAYQVRVHSSNAVGSSSWVESATTFRTRANTPATGAPVDYRHGHGRGGADRDDGHHRGRRRGCPRGFTYQWVRVDADGTSNPVDITDANAATYTLTDADESKKIKVKVSFTDNLETTETLTSSAYPSSGTVGMATTSTAPFTAAWAAGRLHGRRGRERDGHGDAAHRRERADAERELSHPNGHRERFGDGRRRLHARGRESDRGAKRSGTADGAMFTATVALTVETVEDSDFEGDERFYVILSQSGWIRSSRGWSAPMISGTW